ncbi:DUF2264 domain-containing protein [Lacrimispora sp. 210928-DFI.3.58]|uniref:DUF2264 domain-containing protein n=1 Tax=Lacrimispora sp. 210928-DFI.3.58 TaxID=2883214 RepID=UPI001D06DB37|nr:DUF2264 domain-containing protein [Lacrimispora sp. 210928-DFI.3.58]MCB7318162.1 DUF2264 domain-containing protein [Lacrimispora sp. 210928-DFI.3.58]
MAYLEKWRGRALKDRCDMAELFLDIIRPLKGYFSPGHAWLKVGYTKAHYGEKAARMEGFARLLWGLGPLWAQENEDLPKDLREEADGWRVFYLEGIIYGTDPGNEEYWGELLDFDQKMVEMASVASAVCLAPEKLWGELTANQQENFYRWFNQINEREVHSNNWRYFRILVNTMWRKLGLPWNEERMKEDRALIESFYTQKGWYYDGVKTQVDYYIPFAIQFYGLLFSRFMKEEEPEYCSVLRERAAEFSKEFVYWFAGDGSEIPFGRSLTYRFAHSAFFSAIGFAENEGVGYGVMKTLLLRNLSQWMNMPIFDNAGVLTIGYGYPNLIMSDRYNAPGSPYWGLKAFYSLALPADHPFWTAPEEEYAYEPLKLLTEPHMLVSHTQGDHVQAFVTGQKGKCFGCSDAKYEKFVYSNKFGFSVSRGASLVEGAFDSTLAVSLADDDHYRVRRGVEEYQVTEHMLWMKYTIMPGVKVETTIVPSGPWHLRIHQIENEMAIDIADGGYAIATEPEDAVIGTASGRYNGEGIRMVDKGLFVERDWGKSGIISLSGGTAEAVRVLANTNLLCPLTVIPMMKQRLEPGKNTVITLVYGEPKRAESEKN